MTTATTHPVAAGQARRRLRITGQVQGVGFRPAVYRWAVANRLGGFVLNDAHGVVIEAEGDADALTAFESGLRGQLPRLARIDTLDAQDRPPRGDRAFAIAPSPQGHDRGADAGITVDTATCEACFQELRDPGDRRHGHPLINCTDCGPRFSIIDAVPYDRPNTTMRRFAMCDACRAEYEAPADRRFHAQPVCCHDCGPRLSLADPQGNDVAVESGAAIRTAVDALMHGRIVAVKGIGGFHLAVRATDAPAVERLRVRKRRDAKPLAVMVPDVTTAKRLVRLTRAGLEALTVPAASIVLAPKREANDLAPQVAAGTHRLGVMLPYTPVHHLLFEAEPKLGPLVMTSANRSDEPLVTDNDDALIQLKEIADLFLMHDRPIARSVDDSVLLDVDKGLPIPVRRSRGFAPGGIPLSLDPTDRDEAGLCVGGELKTTVAVVRGGEAVLGQHLGDLKHPRAYEHFVRSVDDLLRLFEVEPRWVACDRHPAYLSQAFAARFAERRGLPLFSVQHHHAHAAALLAEHGLRGPMLALVADGVGYGDNGGVWGGELLLADRRGAQRVATLKPLRLPGGDAAARDTRRCALALLYQAFGPAGLDHPIVARLGMVSDMHRTLSGMIRRNVRCVESSAMGRVFDGVAALLGLCFENRFEAEAPMAVEAAAFACRDERIDVAAGSVVTDATPWTLDLSPLVRRLVEGRLRGETAERLAREFQAGLVSAWADVVEHAGKATGVAAVGLTGGVFANEALTLGLTRRLQQRGRLVYRHREVPPNDGGLSLGQAAVAREWSAKRSGVCRKER